LAQVVWTDAAIADLERIGAYIEAFSPLAAQRMASRLVAAALSLEEAPERGRPIGGDRRELAIIPPYLIRYRIQSDLVWVLEVRHGARRPDETS
jgi:plasmid stabilization system protein ParE